MNVLQVCENLINSLHRERHFRATVGSTSGNRISIIRNGQVLADGGGSPIFYAAAAGLAAAVVAGDEVYVVDITGNGGFFVASEITR